MKKIFFFVLILSNFIGQAQYTLIPDVNFEKLLIYRGLDAGVPNGKVLTANLKLVKSLDVSFTEVSNLTGIQDFPALTDLDCSQNKLTSLDCSQNTKLINLKCYNNQLTNLDLSKNSNLTSLRCYKNLLTNLNITENTILAELSCSENQLTILDITKNTVLSELICSENQLTTLDLSQNTFLVSIICDNNKLTNLDVSKNTSLLFLYCYENKLTSLDITKNIDIQGVYCSNNQLNSLYVSKNTSLNTLKCDLNQLTSLDISKNTKLSELDCYLNNLNTLNLKNGNNKKWTHVGLAKNPNLKCIQVDNKAYSDANWSSRKDVTATFSENCANITQNDGVEPPPPAGPVQPPKITATGNGIYCPLDKVKILSTVKIDFDPSESTTEAVYVQISSGYALGSDELLLENSAFHLSKNIIATWDAVSGKLKLSSSTSSKIPYTDFEAALLDVVFTNNSATVSGKRSFSITLGQANFLPSTGHYYEYVSSIGINWTDAKVAAEAKNYYNLKGYLATILSNDEAQLVGKQSSGAGWIGGSDAAVEGEWRWVTGPEGLANGGNGVVFWNGLVNGSTPNFAFWNQNEPNQFGGREEDFVHITAPGVGIAGSWNDLILNGDPTGNYQPKGYIVEYGGMPGDAVLQISASTTLTVSTIEKVSTSNPVCDSGSFVFVANANGLPINWYDAKTGGNLLATTTSFTTPVLNASTSYFAATNCTSIDRTEFFAVVNTSPQIVSTNTPVSRCGSGTVTLTAAATSGVINWYESLNSTSVVGSGNTFILPNVSKDATYYAETIENGCSSLVRTAVDVKIYDIPKVDDENVTKCKLVDIELDAKLSGMSYLWSTGELTQKISVASAGIYTVKVTTSAPENCESTKTITVFENEIPEILDVIVIEDKVEIRLNKEETYFEFSIDGNNYQDSNIFSNAPNGLQTAVVRDKQFCNEVKKQFVVLTVPKFFTPNGDNKNDFWEIKELQFYPQSSLTVFDRFGKFVTLLNANKLSWDGNYNNAKLPSDDYWYVLKIDNSKPEKKGHFALKR